MRSVIWLVIIVPSVTNHLLLDPYSVWDKHSILLVKCSIAIKLMINFVNFAFGSAGESICLPDVNQI